MEKINNTTGEMMREIVGAVNEAVRRQVPPGCEPARPGAVSAWVAGVPAPQGSKRALGAGRPGGKIRLVESSKRVKPWREDVRQAFLDVIGEHRAANRALTGTALASHDFSIKVAPVVVKIVFVMPRTKAMRSRPSADFPMVQKPDVDKLGRAVLDALTSAGVFADDGQVVALHSFKRRAEPGETTGAMIHVEPYRPRSQHCTGCRTGNGDHVFGCELSTPGRNGQPDTPESVEAKLDRVKVFRDLARDHGFTS